MRCCVWHWRISRERQLSGHAVAAGGGEARECGALLRMGFVGGKSVCRAGRCGMRVGERAWALVVSNNDAAVQCSAVQ